MPQFTVTKGPINGEVFPFGGEVVFVGRAAENDIQLKIGQVSRKHFKVYSTGDKIYVEDLNSKNGTAVNGDMIVPGKGVELQENDIISIANIELKVTGLPDAKPAESDPPESEAPDFDVKTAGSAGTERRRGERKNMDLIWGVTELLRQSMDINEILEKVLGYVLGTLPRIDTAVIVLYDQKRKGIWETVSQSRAEKETKRIGYSSDVVNRVLTEGKSIRMSNTKFEPPEEISASITDLGINSTMCVPMISSGEMIGAIYVDSRGPYGFRRDDLLLLNSLSGPVAVAVEKAILAATLKENPV